MLDREIKWCIDFLRELFFVPAWEAYRANQKVQGISEGCQYSDFDEDPRLEHEKEILMDALQVSIQRIEKIEGKATSSLIGIGLLISLLAGASWIVSTDGVLGKQGIEVRIGGTVILIYAMFSFLLSGILALQAYKIDMVYGPTLNDMLPPRDSANGKNRYLFCIEQNERMGTMRSNRLDSSLKCLRNGMVAVGLLTILVTVVALL